MRVSAGKKGRAISKFSNKVAHKNEEIIKQAELEFSLYKPVAHSVYTLKKMR